MPNEETFQQLSVVSAGPADSWGAVAENYRAVILGQLDGILARHEAHPDYLWVDTKFDVMTGEDFDPADPLRRRDVIYGWIQGRGLETLAELAGWIKASADDDLQQRYLPRLDPFITALYKNLQHVRAHNGGHLYFAFDPAGKPFVVDPGGEHRRVSLTDESPYNFTDLFGAKGLYAAVDYLQDGLAKREACRYVQAVSDALFADTFVTDQASLNPRNPVSTVPGRRGQGGFMIQIGAANLLVACEPSVESIEFGLRLCEYLLDHHVNRDGKWPGLPADCFVEFIGDDGAPYQDESGNVLCDPGHSLEFVGLALKFVRLAGAVADCPAEMIARLDAVRDTAMAVLHRCFAVGFQERVGGIVKGYDLKNDRIVSGEMPWWSLPETIRAAAQAAALVGDTESRRGCIDIWRACHNAFLAHYVRPEVHMFAPQTRVADGSVSAAIPAVPDIDPAYHTALSILEAVKLIDAGAFAARDLAP